MIGSAVDILLHASQTTISIDSVHNTRSAHFLEQVIVECLAETEVSQSEHLPLFQQLIACVAAVIEASSDSCSEQSLLLFTIIQRVKGSKHAEILQSEVSTFIINPHPVIVGKGCLQ